MRSTSTSGLDSLKRVRRNRSSPRMGGEVIKSEGALLKELDCRELGWEFLDGRPRALLIIQGFGEREKFELVILYINW